MIHCNEIALKIKVVAGDDEDGGADDTELTTELRKKETKTKKQQTNSKPVCVHLRQSIEVNFKLYESKLSEKVYTEVQTSLIIYIYLERGGAAQRWGGNNGRFIFLYSKRELLCFERVSLRKLLKQKDMMETRSPPPCQSGKKCSVPCSAPSIGNESDIYSKIHVCASSLFV